MLSLFLSILERGEHSSGGVGWVSESVTQHNVIYRVIR